MLGYSREFKDQQVDWNWLNLTHISSEEHTVNTVSFSHLWSHSVEERTSYPRRNRNSQLQWSSRQWSSLLPLCAANMWRCLFVENEHQQGLKRLWLGAQKSPNAGPRLCEQTPANWIEGWVNKVRDSMWGSSLLVRNCFLWRQEINARIIREQIVFPEAGIWCPSEFLQGRKGGKERLEMCVLGILLFLHFTRT